MSEPEEPILVSSPSILHFEFGVKENQAAKDWLGQHQCPSYGRSDSKAGAVGGAITFKFTPTSLGVVAVVSCVCGGSCDVTEYSEW
jgi:hypothetical protein